MTIGVRIGLRDGRLNDRCNGCPKTGQMQDWCDKYRENYHYCINNCIFDHPDCPRDNPEIKAMLQKLQIPKMRQSYLPSCRCETRRVILLDGILRCANCMGSYSEAGLYNYSDFFIQSRIFSVAPRIYQEDKIKDCSGPTYDGDQFCRESCEKTTINELNAFIQRGCRDE